MVYIRDLPRGIGPILGGTEELTKGIAPVVEGGTDYIDYIDWKTGI